MVLLAAGCTSPEKEFANHASQLFAGGEADFGRMCGKLGEAILEQNGGRHLVVQAQIASTEIISRDDEAIHVLVRVSAGASRYLISLIPVECRFAAEPSRTPPWHTLPDMTFNYEPVSEEGVANMNALGIGLAGSYLAQTASQ